LESSITSLMRCASPPNSVGEGWPSVSQPRATSTRGCRRATTSRSAWNQGAASTTVISSTGATDEGYDEAMLLDPSGFVSEGAGENPCIIKKGVVCVPDLSAGELKASRATRSTSATRPSSPALPPK
jgi:Amino-transferase class IV